MKNSSVIMLLGVLGLCACHTAANSSSEKARDDYQTTIDCLTDLETVEELGRGQHVDVSSFSGTNDRFEAIAHDIASKIERQSPDVNIDLLGVKTSAETKSLAFITAPEDKQTETAARLKRNIEICSNKLKQFESEYAVIGR